MSGKGLDGYSCPCKGHYVNFSLPIFKTSTEHIVKTNLEEEYANSFDGLKLLYFVIMLLYL